ncbi:MAG: tRNA adenosine(34) deaminase TadA [Schwartzia sp.]|nr:tRNA adenosine(34) deaminase TadA [Schwartzia sp. (in: firmicutes)]
MRSDPEYMQLALTEARKAMEQGEVPIGAVLVDDEGGVVVRAHNRRETDHDATAHAEIIAIREGGRRLGRWRLSGCTLYVTLEPCPMCAGALVMARLKRVVYGVPDARAGSVESIFNIPAHPSLNHHLEVTAGIAEDECRALLQTFFRARRGGSNG